MEYSAVDDVQRRYLYIVNYYPDWLAMIRTAQRTTSQRIFLNCGLFRHIIVVVFLFSPP
jgi:hypothetical protein